MRIRSTKPEFWRSKTIAQLDWSTRLVLKGLESYVDDNGVGKDDLALIAADVFPRDLSSNPRDTLARLSEAISTLAEHVLIVRYDFDAEDLLYIDRWKDLQRIDKPGKGRFPRPDGTFEYHEPVNRECYGSPRESVANIPEVVAPGAVEQGNRGAEEQGSRPAQNSRGTRLQNDWLPSNPGAVVVPNGVNLQTELDKVRDYWIAQPGVKGRKTDWDATWRNWLRRVTPNPRAPTNGGHDDKVNSYLAFANQSSRPEIEA